MERSTFVLYPLPWWRSRGVVIGVLAAALVLAAWLASPSDDGIRPSVGEPARAAPRVAATHIPEPAPPPPAAPMPVPTPQVFVPAPVPRPAPSTQIAPGVHITPLSVPAGTEPVPAGPRPGDSEPEN